jgi:hypothetical protein
VTPLSQQRASYQLATTLNRHARAASQRHAPARNGDQRQRPAADGGGGGQSLRQTPNGITGTDTVYRVPVNPIAQVWVDCELGRVCICRHELPEFRVWSYAHKAASGSGKIAREALCKYCTLVGLITSRSTFNQILIRGNNLYWKIRGDHIYLTGWRKLSVRLSKWEAKYHPDHVTTNRPGQRRVQLDLTGSLKLAHALIYNGWIAVKSERLGYLEISRWTLEKLWHRSRRQLLAWEQLVGITTELRYAEHHDITAPLVPNYAYLCLDTNGAEFASWRLPNKFTPAPAILSATNGQRRKIRAACNDIVKSTEPIVLRADGQRRLQRTGKTTFTDRTGKNGIIPAHKQLDKHLRKHHDIFDRRHYAYIATRYGKHIFEMSDGTPVRRGAGRDWIAEKSIEFQQQRNLYRLYWLDRGKAL